MKKGDYQSGNRLFLTQPKLLIRSDYLNYFI
jgi:hypothetical protein